MGAPVLGPINSTDAAVNKAYVDGVAGAGVALASLSEATTVAAAALFYVEDSGSGKKITLDNLANTVLVDVQGLAFAMARRNLLM